MIKIYLSSSFSDLSSTRSKVSNWLQGIYGAELTIMETWGSDEAPPDINSVRRVRECELFVGIYAHRYGTIDPKSGESITELELDEAKIALSAGTVHHILLYCINDKASWLREYAEDTQPAVSVPPGSVIDIGIVQMARGPTLTGHVFSANDKQPMVGAVIRFGDARTHAVVSYPPDELTATTDANGRFSVQNMPLLALEMFTSVEKPRHRTFTIGNVDMSLARRGTLEAIFFVDVKDEDLPRDH